MNSITLKSNKTNEIKIRFSEYATGHTSQPISICLKTSGCTINAQEVQLARGRLHEEERNA